MMENSLDILARSWQSISNVLRIRNFSFGIKI